MSARYPRAIKPNYGLDVANAHYSYLGTPKLADTDWLGVDRAMANAAFTLAHTSSGDSLARNVTVKATQAGGQDDTYGIVTVVGTDVEGKAISEVIIPLNGNTVAGALAFLTVSSVTQSTWTAGGTADRIEIGFGALIGLSRAVVTNIANGGLVVNGYVAGIVVAAPTMHANDSVIADNTVNLSAGTFDGSKPTFLVIVTA